MQDSYLSHGREIPMGMGTKLLKLMEMRWEGDGNGNSYDGNGNAYY